MNINTNYNFQIHQNNKNYLQKQNKEINATSPSFEGKITKKTVAGMGASLLAMLGVTKFATKNNENHFNRIPTYILNQFPDHLKDEATAIYEKNVNCRPYGWENSDLKEPFDIKRRVNSIKEQMLNNRGINLIYHDTDRGSFWTGKYSENGNIINTKENYVHNNLNPDFMAFVNDKFEEIVK